MRRKKIGCLPIIMLVSFGAILVTGWIYHKDNVAYKKLEKQVTYQEKQEKKQTNDDDGYRVNWKKLKNKDVVGWIRFIHPKVISYPILQEEDNEFYLHRNIKKEYSFAGSIFMDYHNEKNFSESNTIIYGHNMANESMFGSLKKYKEKKYWEKNKYFYIYTKDRKRRKYKIYNVCVVRPGSEIYTYRFASDDSLKEYIRYYKSIASYKTGITPKTSDHIVTLSTCSLQGTRRFVIQGYLIDTVELR